MIFVLNSHKIKNEFTEARIRTKTKSQEFEDFIFILTKLNKDFMWIRIPNTINSNPKLGRVQNLSDHAKMLVFICIICIYNVSGGWWIMGGVSIAHTPYIYICVYIYICICIYIYTYIYIYFGPKSIPILWRLRNVSCRWCFARFRV